MAHYVDSVDVVGFIRQATVVVGKDGEHKRAVATGDRVLVTYLTPSAITKNRVGIDQDIPIVRGVNPFAQYMGQSGAVSPITGPISGPAAPASPLQPTPATTPATEETV
jgi:hypothetical protein